MSAIEMSKRLVEDLLAEDWEVCEKNPDFTTVALGFPHDCLCYASNAQGEMKCMMRSPVPWIMASTLIKLAEERAEKFTGFKGVPMYDDTYMRSVSITELRRLIDRVKDLPGEEAFLEVVMEFLF